MAPPRKIVQDGDEMYASPWTGHWNWEICYEGFWLIDNLKMKSILDIQL